MKFDVRSYLELITFVFLTLVGGVSFADWDFITPPPGIIPPGYEQKVHLPSLSFTPNSTEMTVTRSVGTYDKLYTDLTQTINVAAKNFIEIRITCNNGLVDSQGEGECGQPEYMPGNHKFTKGLTWFGDSNYSTTEQVYGMVAPFTGKMEVYAPVIFSYPGVTYHMVVTVSTGPHGN